MLALRQSIEVEQNRLDGLDRRMFWIAALRNRQLGLWAAHTMEMEIDQSEDYADQVVALGMQTEGELEIVDKLTADFARAGMDIPTELICFEMAQRTLSAERQLIQSPAPDLPGSARGGIASRAQSGALDF